MRTTLVVSFFAATALSFGSAISSSSNLVTLLGGPGTVENFSGFTVANGDSVQLGCSTVNSSSTCNGQGPNLVTPGVQFTFGNGGGQWDGVGYQGSDSEEIVAGSPAGQPLVITFTTLVTAFGLDLRAFTDYPATATVTVFALNDTTVLGTVSGIDLSSNGSSVFAGWEDSSGIGGVELTQSGEYWSPVLDFLEYGTMSSDNDDPATPEPASFICVGLGIGAIAIRRRLSSRARTASEKPGN